MSSDRRTQGRTRLRRSQLRRARVQRGPLRRTGRAAVRRRMAIGATFLWFGLIGMPALFFGAAMAVDFTRIIIAGREMHNALQAAALAGAYQFQDFSNGGDPTKVDATGARLAAHQTLAVAVQSGELHLTTMTVGQAEQVPVTLTSGGTSVVVRTTYSVDGLVFSDLLANIFGSGRGAANSGYQATATAFVCDPAVRTGPTQGFCVRPHQWR